MVFLTTHAKRTPVQKCIRFLFGATLVLLIVFALSQVPYDILREERFRLYGEAHTVGRVTSVRTITADSANSRCVVDYKYVDQDGFVRQASARLSHDVWVLKRPGDTIDVFYARPRPALSRVRGEIEPAFQVWLRDILQ